MEQQNDSKTTQHAQAPPSPNLEPKAGGPPVPRNSPSTVPPSKKKIIIFVVAAVVVLGILAGIFIGLEVSKNQDIAKMEEKNYERILGKKHPSSSQEK